MHNLTEIGTWLDNVPMPDDGVDYRTAASLEPALIVLANRARALYEFLGSLTGTVALPANLSIAGSTNSHGQLTASAALHCVGAATFDSTITNTGGVVLNGGATGTTLAMSGNISTTLGRVSAQGLDIALNSNLNACTVNDLETNICNTVTLAVSTTSIFQGSCTFHGGAFLDSVITCTGAGRAVRPAVLGITTGSASLDPARATTWIFGGPANVLTGNVSMTLTGGDGEEVEVSVQGNIGFFVNILNPGGSLLIALESFGAGTTYYAKVKRVLGAWYVINTAVR